jgi:hypothetical protein
MSMSQPTIKGFLKAFGANWVTKMSGPPTVPFTLAALFVPQAWLRTLFAVLAIVCAFVSSYAVWAAERKNAKESADKLDSIESARPKICLRQVKVSDVSFVGGSNTSPVVLFTAPFIKASVSNDPTNPYPNAETRGVSAKLRYFRGRERTQLLEISGRWADSDQPSARDFKQSRRDLLEADFRIGAEHELDIGFRDPQTGEFIAWNNDNYDYQDMKKPEHRLVGELFRVEVHLRGTWVDELFTVRFTNTAKGLAVAQE